MSDLWIEPNDKPCSKVEVPNFDNKLTQAELNWIALKNKQEDEELEDGE